MKGSTLLDRRLACSTAMVNFTFDRVVRCLLMRTTELESFVGNEIEKDKTPDDSQEQWEQQIHDESISNIPKDMDKTPTRALRGLLELTAGMDDDTKAITSRGQSVVPDADQIVLFAGLDFTSMCRHHLLPFTGTAIVGYLPRDGLLIGASKAPRVVQAFARRLQIQEQMTVQIRKAIVEAINPLGVGVIVQAKHACMACRGIRAHNASMKTSDFSGVFREDGPARSEFMDLISLSLSGN